MRTNVTRLATKRKTDDVLVPRQRAGCMKSAKKRHGDDAARRTIIGVADWLSVVCTFLSTYEIFCLVGRASWEWSLVCATALYVIPSVRFRVNSPLTMGEATWRRYADSIHELAVHSDLQVPHLGGCRLMRLSVDVLVGAVTDASCSLPARRHRPRIHTPAGVPQSLSQAPSSTYATLATAADAKPARSIAPAVVTAPCPQLVDLCLPWVNRADVHSGCIPWSSLRACRLTSARVMGPRLGSVLSQLSSVSVVHIGEMSLAQVASLSRRRICVPTATAVTIHTLDGANLGVWEQIFDAFPNATRWEFTNCVMLDDDICDRLSPRCCARIRVLRFSGTLIGHSGLRALLANTPALVELSLRYNSRVSVDVVDDILRQPGLCPALTKLDLDPRISVSDVVLARWRTARLGGRVHALVVTQTNERAAPGVTEAPRTPPSSPVFAIATPAVDAILPLSPV